MNDYEKFHRLLKDHVTYKSMAGDPGWLIHDLVQLNKDKINLHFWIDVSGSVGEVDNLLTFVNAVPHGKDDLFDVYLGCFDTQIYPMNIGDKKITVRGYGGTNLQVVEDHIQHLIQAENYEYPDLVCVITDGCFPSFLPEKPERWAFFLTSNDFKLNIDGKSYRYQLHDK